MLGKTPALSALTNSFKEGPPQEWTKEDDWIPKPVQRGFDAIAEHVPGVLQVWGSGATLGATMVGTGQAALALGANQALAVLLGSTFGLGIGLVPILILMARNGLGQGGVGGPNG